jgi:hypothetical protein
VLDGAGFAVGEFDFGAGRFGIGVRAGVGIRGVVEVWFGFGCGRRVGREGFAVPFGIAEVVVGFYEVVDGEVVLAFVEAGAAADDLFELDHGVDGAEEDDVADVAGVDAGGEFLGGGEDGGDGLFVVLEVAEVEVAEGAIVGGDTGAVVGVRGGFVLID